MLLQVELFLNKVYYSLYNINFFIGHYVFGKPIVALFARPLYCIPFVRKHLEKKGLTFDSWTKISQDTSDRILSDKYTIRFMSFVLLSPFLLLAETLMILIGNSFRTLLFENLLLFLIILVVVTYLINYRFVWKNDLYFTKYLPILEKEPMKKKVLWGIGTFLYCILSLVLMFLLLYYAEKMHTNSL